MLRAFAWSSTPASLQALTQQVATISTITPPLTNLVQSETTVHGVAAQALGYKIGPARNSEAACQYSKDQLGAKFDLRSFHDEVLQEATASMDVLRTRITNGWHNRDASALSLSVEPESKP